MAVQIGKLNKRLIFLEPSYVDDGFQNVATFAPHPRWGSLAVASDSEHYQAGTPKRTQIVRVIIRKYPEVTPNWRFQYSGVTYDITGVKPLVNDENYYEITGLRKWA